MVNSLMAVILVFIIQILTIGVASMVVGYKGMASQQVLRRTIIRTMRICVIIDIIVLVLMLIINGGF